MTNIASLDSGVPLTRHGDFPYWDHTRHKRGRRGGLQGALCARSTLWPSDPYRS
jgi:hypothetical protein